MFWGSYIKFLKSQLCSWMKFLVPQEPLNQLNKADITSQRLKQSEQSLHGSPRGSLHLNYSFQLSVFMGLLGVWTSGPLILVSSFGLFSFCWFALSSLDVMLIVILCYVMLRYVTLRYVMLCYVLLCFLILLEAWSFLMRDRKRADLKERGGGKERGTGRSGGRGHYHLDIVYEKRIYFQ